LKYFIDTNLANTLRLHPNVVFLDCRFQLADSSYGYKTYVKNHIPHARFVDLKNDLSSEVQKHGGRHPLPDLNDFSELLGKLGIDQNTIVICYDDGLLDNAARCWFLCRLVGHQFTFVLNGGYKEWIENGFEVTEEIANVTPKKFEANINDHMVSFISDVKEKQFNDNVNLIDSREYIRYKGEVEPIDRIAGHIPGAKHSFWKDVLNENGRIKSKEELKNHYKYFSKDKESIVYCGSGVTGCVNYLGLIEAEYPNVKLYAGSFSDWISYEENVVNKVDL